MLNRLYTWYGKRNVQIVAGIILILIIAVFFIKKDTDELVTTPPTIRTVAVASVSSFANNTSIELVGNVESINEARIENEVAGRITSVSAVLGGTVTTGQIIAQLENASERASVLQAEGVYDAAVAASVQGNIGVDEAQNALTNAENNAQTTYRNSYATLENNIKNTIDKLFSDVNNPILGFRIESGTASSFIADRKEVQTILNKWSIQISTTETSSNILNNIIDAQADALFIANFIESLSSSVNDSDNDSKVLEGVPMTTFRDSFSGSRIAVNGVLTSLESAKISLESAQDTLLKAEIGGSTNDVSAANAQIKQALGSLRLAQANLEKTILRTPISGTVNLMSVKTGDFVAAFSRIATIANNNALEITTFVGETDREKLAIGNIVRIENKYEGVITNIAPAVDPLTKKVEVIIQSEINTLSNGDTVRVSITSDSTPGDTAEIAVPLTSVKFSASNGVVFTVENEIITSHPVVLGAVSGSNVLITEGLTSDMVIIVDARGLNQGQKVTPITN